MALKTENVYNPTSSTQEFPFTFPYRQESDIKVTHDREDVTFTLPNATTVRLDTAISSGELRIWRETNTDTSPSTFYPGSAIKSADLNDNFEQVLYCAEELKERYVDQRGVKSISKDLRFEGSTANAFETILSVTDPTVRDQTYRLPNIPTNNTTSGAATNGIYDIITTGTPSVDLEGDLNVAGNFEVTGTSLHTGQQTVPGGAQVKNIKVGLDAPNEVSTTTGNLVLDSATGTVAIDDALTVAGSLTVTGTTILAANSIGTSEIADDAVTSVKIADATIVAGNIATNTITGTQIADDAISEAEIADNAVTAAKVNANAIGTTKIIDDAVTTAKINADAVTGAKIADNTIDSEHYAAASIDTEHIADANVTTSKLATGAVTNAKIASSAVTASSLGDNAVTTNKIVDNAVTAAKIADAAIITNSEQAASTPDDVTFFTTAAAEARYFNQSTSETIKDGDTFPDNDTTIATTAAINDRIIDLVDDVGGFVPIANETSFPNANPDVNNGAGTIVSISTLASNHTSSGSGVITISNGTVGNSTVTINGAENSTTYSAGYGLLVETTTTLNTYTFHRLVPKATEVTTVAGKATEIGRLGTAAAVEDLGILGTTAVVEDMSLLGTTACVADMALLGTTACIADMATIADTSNLIANIGTVAGIQANVTTVAGNNSNVTTVATNISSVNDFAARYRVASSAPTSSLDVGDLYFDTTANELKVYNGSAWQGGVTATGSFAVVTGNTFTGNNIYNDNIKARFGSDSDFSIYHDNSHATLDNDTGDTYIKAAGMISLNPNNTNDGLLIKAGGACELYHNNSKKFETTAAGATLTGGFTTTAASTFVGDFTLDNGTNAGNDLVWDESDDSLTFKDNVYAKWGTGGDLVIYHTGSHSYIDDNGTGILAVRSNGTEVAIAKTSGDSMGRFITDGAVELFYNATKKFETTSAGAQVTGNLRVDGMCDLYDDKYARFGDSADLSIYHNGSNSYIKNITGGLNISSADGQPIQLIGGANLAETLATFTDNGACEFYYDNSKKLHTNSDGIYVTGDITFTGNVYGGDGDKLRLGVDQDLEISHDGSNTIIVNKTGRLIDYVNTNEIAIDRNPNGSVDLYHDGVKKFETVAAGINVTGGIGIGDTTPSYSIDVKAAQPHIRLEENSSGGSKRLEMLVTSAGQAKIAASQSAQTIIIETAGVERCAVTGNGITFNGDTAAANALDDYEEGTWTPALGGSGNSFTYHANTGGVYTKIGRMVYASGFIQLTARSGTTQLSLTGLPFAAGDHSSGSSNVQGGVHTQRIDNSQAATSGPMGTISNGESTAALWHAISSGNGSGLDADEIDTTFTWAFTVIYPA